MKVDSLNDLSKLLDLCRKKGVSAISVDGISLQISDYTPTRRSRDNSADAGDSATSNTPTWDDLSPEEQMFYSAGGIPLQPASKE